MRSLYVLFALIGAASCGSSSSSESRERRCLSCKGFPYDPVCGSNGKTFRNFCALIDEICVNPGINLKRLYDGTCVNYDVSIPLPRNKQPPILYSPIDCTKYTEVSDCSKLAEDPCCGNDLEDYDNECLMCKAKKDKLNLRHKGYCKNYERALAGKPPLNSRGEKDIDPLVYPRLPNCRDALLPCSFRYGDQVCAFTGVGYEDFGSECLLCSHWRKVSTENDVSVHYLVTKVGGIC